MKCKKISRESTCIRSDQYSRIIMWTAEGAQYTFDTRTSALVEIKVWKRRNETRALQGVLSVLKRVRGRINKYMLKWLSCANITWKPWVVMERTCCQWSVLESLMQSDRTREELNHAVHFLWDATRIRLVCLAIVIRSL